MPEEQIANPYKVLTIREIIPETPTFKTFVFDTREALPYQSGQFLTFVDHNEREELRRSYSIVSSPAFNEPLAIGVKRVANGFFSRKLIDRAKVGDPLYTTGAAGFFKLPERIDAINQIYFFAAGSGIAPIYSLIKTVLRGHPHIRVRLVYSSPSLESTAYYHQLSALESQYRNVFNIHFLFSSIPDLRKARLNRELMIELLAAAKADRSSTFFYTCGPAVYMRMITYQLQEQGFPSDHIKKEDFNPRHSAMPKAIPPDTGSHQVVLKMNEHVYRFTVNYPDTILKAAQRAKIFLPYSCETGKCGSCAMRCLEGKVWLSYNEVLTEKDLSKGLTLTCTGHPVGGDVVITGQNG
ncbi:MAG TPA: ferredoxin--NADP reductase [Puia sp.]|nr:ferredoxin--NADP reductase [Puia sp.]